MLLAVLTVLASSWIALLTTFDLGNPKFSLRNSRSRQHSSVNLTPIIFSLWSTLYLTYLTSHSIFYHLRHDLSNYFIVFFDIFLTIGSARRVAPPHGSCACFLTDKYTVISTCIKLTVYLAICSIHIWFI